MYNFKWCKNCSNVAFTFQSRVTTVFLSVDQDVEDQQNGLCQVLVLLHVISFCGDGPNRRSTNQSQEYVMNWNSKFEILLLLFIKMSQGKVSSLCIPGFISVYKMLGPVFKYDTTW
jgi:hypothetical protein